jgi:hypothetical protein
LRFCGGERIAEHYSVDGHGDSMYFGAFVKYQNIGLSLANSNISEYFGQLHCFVAAAAGCSYLMAWRNWNMEVPIAQGEIEAVGRRVFRGC